MRPPLKLSAIDQEHLQELYDAAGVARDELPYTEAFELLWQGFQDRTFKNAEREQVYAALLKYVRSGSNQSKNATPETLSDEQVKQLKALLPRHVRGGKLLPYSDEYDGAMKEFNKLAGTQLSERQFWESLSQAQGTKRRPPRRTKAAAPAKDPDDDGE